MTQHDFCMWLNGYVELDGKTPTDDQWEMIKEHLALLFNKTTRSIQDIEGVRVRRQFLDTVNKELIVPEGPTEIKVDTPLKVDGPTEVQKPWVIPELQYPNFQRNKPWFERTQPFDLNNLKVTC